MVILLEENIEYATKYDLNRVDKRLTQEISANREKIEEHDRTLSRLETLYASLEGLPSTIVSLDKTITIIGNNLESMSKNLEEVRKDVHLQGQAINNINSDNKEQNEKIEEIDNKSKIDLLEFVTKNFWKIFSLLGVGYLVIKSILEGG